MYKDFLMFHDENMTMKDWNRNNNVYVVKCSDSWQKKTRFLLALVVKSLLQNGEIWNAFIYMVDFPRFEIRTTLDPTIHS